MKRISLFLAAALACQAGVLRVATFPVRHPVKVVKTVSYPVRHPVKAVF